MNKLDIVDPKWQKLQIYCIICMTTGEMYVGSTIKTLKERMQRHINSHDCNSLQIIERGNYKSFTIQKWPCNTKREALTLEGQWQQAYKTSFPDHLVNKYIEGKFCKENPEKKKNYDNKYYEEHSEVIKSRSKQYREEHGDKCKAYGKEWGSRPWTCEWCNKTMTTGARNRHKKICKSKPTQ